VPPIRRVTGVAPVTPNRWGQVWPHGSALTGRRAAPTRLWPWQARFRGPDGIQRPAPVTFDSKLDADAWLASQTRDSAVAVWAPPRSGVPVSARCAFGTTQTPWLERPRPEASTRALYRDLLDDLILPTLGDIYLDKDHANDGADVARPARDKTPTRRAHAYSLLRPYALPRSRRDHQRQPLPHSRRRAARKVHESRPATLPELR